MIRKKDIDSTFSSVLNKGLAVGLIALGLVLFTALPSDAQKAKDKKGQEVKVKEGNPVFKHKNTADPAAFVQDSKVYLYAGHDEAPNDFHFYRMNEWLVFSSTDMVNWTEHPVPLKPSDFKMAKGDAWAAEFIEKDGNLTGK